MNLNVFASAPDHDNRQPILGEILRRLHDGGVPTKNQPKLVDPSRNFGFMQYVGGNCLFQAKVFLAICNTWLDRPRRLPPHWRPICAISG